MKKKIPDALRLKLSKAGKKGWRAKINKYKKVVATSCQKRGREQKTIKIIIMRTIKRVKAGKKYVFRLLKMKNEKRIKGRRKIKKVFVMKKETSELWLNLL